jgi:hypothetical protein
MRAVLLALLLAAGPALAQDRPALSPSRDVDVIYLMAGPDGPLEQRLRWGVTEGKLRVDPPSPGIFMVLDTRSHRMETVREADRTVLQVDQANMVALGVQSAASFTRRGTSQVAGLDCTQWETTDNAGKPTLACITEDGVLLRAVAGGRVMVVAAEVRYVGQGEAVFRIPADYRRIIAPPVKR